MKGQASLQEKGLLVFGSSGIFMMVITKRPPYCSSPPSVKLGAHFPHLESPVEDIISLPFLGPSLLGVSTRLWH